MTPVFEPTPRPSPKQSDIVSEKPSKVASVMPSESPTWHHPTDKPIDLPSYEPSLTPTILLPVPPTSEPKLPPVASMTPSESPTWHPTDIPTDFPTYEPSFKPTALPSMSPSDYPSASPALPTLLPTLWPLALSPFAYFDYQESCTSSQIRLRLEISTDNYPRDTSWKFIDRTTNVVLLSSPVDGYSGRDIGNGMMAAQTDIREICLGLASAPRSTGTTKNKYEFVLRDDFGDGLCCRPGVESGYYKLLKKEGGANAHGDVWQIIVAGSDFHSKEVSHHFVLGHKGSEGQPDIIQATMGDDFETVVVPTTMSLELLCPSPQRKITIQIQTDKFGHDTSWDFRVKNGEILAKNERSYTRYEVDERVVCVEDSALYELTIYDNNRDGMYRLRSDERDGHYKIFAHRGPDRETILYGGFFWSEKITHLLNTTMPAMDERDVEWLNSHNKRRRYWHPYYNTTYVPLQWSEKLKAEAKVWADTLLDSCGDGMHHDPQRDWGENAAANSGAGSWATRRPPDKIVARFIDREVGDPWPINGHLTQALWRASHYVGCAESHKLMDADGIRECHTQVCRYARTGNCNMNAYTDETGAVDWLTPMLEDANYCGPICPNDGCRA
ncbi:hypothetical protein ACHAXA_011504 [Cyclostephanos tholiformis]|uniref:SCP domain-containing protein n=1 Tax=Cyclostephanos tholiformis TaxID=382380 RepID=A0ABD3SDN8_9STRA